MKGTRGSDQPNRRLGPDEDPQDTPVVFYSPEQIMMIRKGLRIWARVAIRSYMHKQAGETQGKDDSGEDSNVEV